MEQTSFPDPFPSLTLNPSEERLTRAAEHFRDFLKCFFPYSYDHMQETPKRVARMWEEFFGPHNGWFEPTTFPNVDEIDPMIIIEDLTVYSMCAHHLLPFFGKAHIAYIPADKLLGLSKFARITQMFAHRPQIQETLTHQIASYLNELLEPRGVAVVLQCEHLCMSMRGVKNPGHCTTTSTLFGAFLEIDNPARLEFLSLIAHK